MYAIKFGLLTGRNCSEIEMTSKQLNAFVNGAFSFNSWIIVRTIRWC